MTEPIEELYFNWLCAKVLSGKVHSYKGLLEILHKTEFIWLVPKDRNRAQDGSELRTDFLRETQVDNNHQWFDVGCSIFEMLVAFANRVSFQTDAPAKDWFWEFITNLDLGEYRQVSEDDIPVIDDILYEFVWRTYKSNGDGGMFPLRWPKEDQAGVEIWYQFCQYLDDQGRL